MKNRLIALVAGLTIVAAACGSLQQPGATPSTSTTHPPSTTSTTSTTTEPAFTASLDITIGTKDKPGEFTTSLACGSTVSATGYLADTAPDACDFLASTQDARTRLIDGVPKDRACTEIYGGGEVADISGSINGTAVSTTVDRANGCGIADWDLLRPILVEPYDILRETCSAARLEPKDPDPQGDLPAPVAAMREELLGLASVCNYDDLAAIATQDTTNISFGDTTDPASFWRSLEANGGTPMADLESVLQLTPGTIDAADGTIYVWPGVFAMDWSNVTSQQRQELVDIFGQDAVDGWDAFGSYIGYRVGITADGHWAYFVAGD